MSDGGVQRIAVHSGFVEVSDNHVALLSDVAELAEDIDTDRAKNALDRANEILAGDSENEEASMALQRAEVRLLAADVAAFRSPLIVWAKSRFHYLGICFIT